MRFSSSVPPRISRARRIARARRTDYRTRFATGRRRGGRVVLAIPTVEVFRRPGFSIERHAISMLSLGDGGWIMKAVFVVSGLLTLLCAIGLYLALARAGGGIVAPLLVGIYGSGLILAGLFDAPAGLGFPAGIPADQQPIMTTAAKLHGLAFMIAFGSLILSCLVFAFTFLGRGESLWAMFSLLTGLMLPLLVGLGMSMTIAPGIAFYWAAMLGWLWLGAVAFQWPQTA